MASFVLNSKGMEIAPDVFAQVDPPPPVERPKQEEDEAFLRLHGWRCQLTNFGQEYEWSHENMEPRTWLPTRQAVELQVKILAGTGRWM